MNTLETIERKSKKNSAPVFKGYFLKNKIICIRMGTPKKNNEITLPAFSKSKFLRDKS
jgi:hypothetical protein